MHLRSTQTRYMAAGKAKVQASRPSYSTTLCIPKCSCGSFNLFGLPTTLHGPRLELRCCPAVPEGTHDLEEAWRPLLHLGLNMCTPYVCAFAAAQMERRERLRRFLAQQEAVTAELPAVGQVVVQEMAPAQVCARGAGCVCVCVCARVCACLCMGVCACIVRVRACRCMCLYVCVSRPCTAL